MSWDSLQGGGVTWAASPTETERFGVGMARLTVGWDVRPDGQVAVGAVAAQITDLLRTQDVDVVVVRYPASSLALSAAVARSGRQVFAAGSLTYWSAAAGAISAPAPTETLQVRTLAEVHAYEPQRAALVDAVVADAFSGYSNHYSANPLLAADAALAGYQQWARRSALTDPTSALVLLRDGRAVGLATLLNGKRPGGHVEVLLAGLTTAAQGRGRYGVLFGGVVRATAARRRQEVVISTQSHNVRVQRAWARLGLRPFAAVETVHAVRPDLELRP